VECVICPPPDPARIVVGWRAWYSDGKVFSSKTTRWHVLPADGVLIIILYYADARRRIMQGADYYFIASGVADAIYGESGEPPEAIVARYPDAIVKRGRWTDDATYAAVLEVAMASSWG
jgi:hypothetical protein